MSRLIIAAIDPSGSYDIPYKVFPQRGLTKAYEWARVRTLPGSNFDSLQVKPIESREGIPLAEADVPISTNEALVEMQGVCVRYGDKEVLGGWEQEVGGQGKKGLFWTVRRGERWGVFGPNGMCSLVHQDLLLELTFTRKRKNNTILLDLL